MQILRSALGVLRVWGLLKIVTLELGNAKFEVSQDLKVSIWAFKRLLSKTLVFVCHNALRV